MAKILFTAVVADMRNKLAGTVFSKNKAGAYARTKVSPVNRRTADQTIVRQRLGTLSQGWRGLSSEQRSAWSSASANFPKKDQFGNTYFLTGAQLYVGLNTNLATAAQSGITTPLAPVEIPEYTIETVTADASTPNLLITMSGAVPAGCTLIVQATQQVSAGRTFVSNLFRQINVIPAGTAMAARDFIIGYTAKFGALAAGNVIGIRCYLISDESGQAGVPSDILVTIVP